MWISPEKDRQMMGKINMKLAKTKPMKKMLSGWCVVGALCLSNKYI